MMMSKKGEIFIGTSGWQYDHWCGNFYPHNLSRERWLSFYSRNLNTVEVNSSFYGQIRAPTFEKWVNEVSGDFVFSVKGSRYVTHIKRLENCEEALDLFFENAKPLIHSNLRLKAKHVVLWQLPPSLGKDIGRFEDFLECLAKVCKQKIKGTSSNWRHAFEFRHESWVDLDVIDSMVRVIEVEGTVVFQDWKEWPRLEDFIKVAGGLNPLVRKLPFIYTRFHGREGLYASEYSEEELADFSEKAKKWALEGLDVYVYFNNDALGHAISNAQTLRMLVGMGETGGV